MLIKGVRGKLSFEFISIVLLSPRLLAVAID